MAGFFDKFGGQIMDGALSSGFGSLGSLVSSGFNYRRNKDLLALQNQYAAEAATTAFRRQNQFYDKQNAYNDPSAVKARYQAAGINPNAAFGVAGSYQPAQQTPSVGQADTPTPPYVSHRGFEMSNPFDEAMKMAQIRLMDAQAKKLQGDTLDPDVTLEGQRVGVDAALAKVAGQKLTNDMQEFDLDFKREVLDTEIQIRHQTAANMAKQADEMNARIQTLIDQHENNPTLVKEMESRIYVNSMQAALAEVRSRLTEAQISTEGAEFLKKVAETKNLNELNTLIDRQIETEGASKRLIDAKAEIEKINLSDKRFIWQFTRAIFPFISSIL